MPSPDKLIYAIASSSLWLAASGFVLWLCLQSRLRLSPSTRAAASVLIALQGWIWIGIPVQLDPAWIPQQLPKQYAAAFAAVQHDQPRDTERTSDTALRHATTLASIQSASLNVQGSVANIARPLTMLPASATLLAIWLAGIATLIWRSFRGFAALSRMVDDLPPAPAAWQNELSALCVKTKINRLLALKAGNVATPLLVQTWTSACIVVPVWLWHSCTADQRTSILLHELAHYRRGDLWRQLAMRLLILPHWFNPVAWWAATHFDAASEAACDDAACGGDSCTAISYSKALLVLSEHAGLRYSPALAITGSPLTERIRRVLNPDFQKESQMSKFLILTAMVMLTSLAAIRIRAADAKNEAIEKASATEEAADEPGPVLRKRTIVEEFDKADSAKDAAKDSASESSKSPAKEPAKSLLRNGSFEQPQEQSNDPNGWFGTRLPTTAGHFVMGPSTVAHGGKKSVYVEIGESHPEQRVAYNWTSVAKGFEVGETYELSGWVKTEKAKQTAFIMAQFWDEEAAPDRRAKMIGGATTQMAHPVTGTTDWTRVSTRLKVPAGTKVVQIRAGLSSQDNRGAKAWFDDVSLVKIAAN